MHLVSYFSSVVPLWNSLPQHTISANLQLTFKHSLKKLSYNCVLSFLCLLCSHLSAYVNLYLMVTHINLTITFILVALIAHSFFRANFILATFAILVVPACLLQEIKQYKNVHQQFIGFNSGYRGASNKFFLYHPHTSILASINWIPICYEGHFNVQTLILNNLILGLLGRYNEAVIPKHAPTSWYTINSYPKEYEL